jgi:Transglutaminase-like superfamily
VLKRKRMLVRALALLFRPIWWLANLLLAVSLIATIWSGVKEFEVRQYLKGFSNAIVPEAGSPQQKVEAILAWINNGPENLGTEPIDTLSRSDPRNTINYQHLLETCGSVTYAFLDLSRSAGLEARPLLLLSPEYTTKHAVAEVRIDNRWVIIDPSYGVLMRSARGNLLTREDLENPEALREATSSLTNYSPEYTYERVAHVRLAALPFNSAGIRTLLDRLFLGWDDYLDLGLFFERRSFRFLATSGTSLIFLLLVRAILAWVADQYLRIPRFHFLATVRRGVFTFFKTPNVK